MARKWQRLSDEGLNLEPLPVPKQPMTGWELLDGDKADSITCNMPKISHGTMYQYLSSGAGRVCDVEGTTFRALYKGYNHWASGRVDKIEVNTQNPFYCFIRCSVTPSMKQGQYKVYLLLYHRADGYGDIKTASCQCAAG